MMALSSYKYAAPGSLMLCGEHAVLRGYPALVAAVDQTITVELTPDPNSNSCYIDSHLGQAVYSLAQPIQVEAPFHYVLAIIQHYQAQMRSGFTLKISSQFSSTVGLGSSSAVTVAALACMHQWLGLSCQPADLFNIARQLIRAQQGQASGADVAASLLGGVVLFKGDVEHSKSIDAPLPNIVVIYSGSKMKTAEVIQYVNARAEKQRQCYNDWFAEIGQITEHAAQALQQQNWKDLAQYLAANQRVMSQMALNNKTIESILDMLTEQADVLTSKISGSGLGDSVIGLCQPGIQPVIHLSAAQQAQGVTQLNVRLSSKGLCRLI